MLANIKNLFSLKNAIVATVVGVSALTFLASGDVALAQPAQCPDPSACLGGIQFQRGGNLIDFIKELINLAIALAALVAVGFLVYSGFQYITSNGDEKKVEGAQKGITYAVVGLVICFIATVVVQFVIEQVI